MRRWFISSVVSGQDGSVILSASQSMIARRTSQKAGRRVMDSIVTALELKTGDLDTLRVSGLFADRK
jgi:hypothetical protein